jgi:hypothetical protein
LEYKLFFFAVTIFIALILGNHVPVYSMDSHQHHMNTDLERSMSVNDSSKSHAEQIMTNCQDGDKQCPMMALNELNKTESRQAVLGTFSDLILLYDKNNYSCHNEGHHLGIWLYDYTKNLKEALNYTTLLCGGSVFHGIFQSYFDGQQRLTHNEDKSQINITLLCPIDQENVNWQYERDCIHGIGHGLTKLYNYNTTAAVDRCNELIPIWAQSSCSKGVFMENNNYFWESGKGDFDESDIYYPCNRIVEKFAPQCYSYHSDYLLKISNSTDQTKIFAYCDNISPDKFTKYCFQGIGRILSQLAYTNPEQAIAYCTLGNQSHHDDCLTGTLRTMLKQNAELDDAFKFCSLSNLDFKAKCYELVGVWIKAFLHPNKQQWESECAKAPDIDYVSNCINSSQETSVQLKILGIDE